MVDNLRGPVSNAGWQPGMMGLLNEGAKPL